MRPAAETSSSSTQRSTRTCRNSTRSNSSTRVSANSTKVWASRSSFISSTPSETADDHPAVHSPVCSVSGRSSSVLLIESDAPGHHVGGQLRQGTVVGERAGPQAGERLAHADAQLNRDHAGGLVDLGWGSELPIGGGVAVLGADPGPFVEQE